MANPRILIKLTDVCFGYPGREHLVDNANLTLSVGDRVGLMAPNGSGKTTLFHIIMGLIKPTAGQIDIFGKTMETETAFSAVRPRIGLLFQDSDDQLFSPTVIEDVAFGPLNMGKSKPEALSIAKETLALLGLTAYEDHVTYKLSGGEKRLVALATILALQPDVLLLDEPSTGLDRTTRERMATVLEQMEIPYLLISHNMDLLQRLTTIILTMEHGRLIVNETAKLHAHYHLHTHGETPHEH